MEAMETDCKVEAEGESSTTLDIKTEPLEQSSGEDLYKKLQTELDIKEEASTSEKNPKEVSEESFPEIASDSTEHTCSSINNKKRLKDNANIQRQGVAVSTKKIHTKTKQVENKKRRRNASDSTQHTRSSVKNKKRLKDNANIQRQGVAVSTKKIHTKTKQVENKKRRRNASDSTEHTCSSIKNKKRLKDKANIQRQGVAVSTKKIHTKTKQVENKKRRRNASDSTEHTCSSVKNKKRLKDNANIQRQGVAVSTKKIHTKTKQVENKKRRREHHCPYCDILVLNFARHLERQHRGESEVKRYMSLGKNNPTRKRIIEKIRKEGDFTSGKYVPVQERIEKQNSKKSSYELLLCIHCKGYYSKITLRRHVNHCFFNNNKKSTIRQHHELEHHALLTDHFEPKDSLRLSGVLRSLKPDEISFVAMKDKIICEVARRYIKCHKHKYLVRAAKYYMRKLARLLIEVRKIENDKSLSLLSLLHPSKYKVIITALKEISQYDAEKKRFNSPSLVLQMRTLIKKAITAAYSLEVQIDENSPTLNILNATKKLIEKELSTEILIKKVRTKTKHIENKKRRRKHHCPYCDSLVQNFARHLERQHRGESEVKRYMSLGKNNPTRKKMIEKIRKEGDFTSGNYVPVQEKIETQIVKNSSFELLPCIHCKGYYSKITLRRHAKRCFFNKNKGSTIRQRHRSEGHTLLAGHFELNDPLRSSGILRSLNPDEVSFVAKKDKVICEVARMYIKCHTQKYLLTVAKRYMRRLARLLMEVRKIENDKSLSLLSLLHPSKFKVIITALKAITQYDAEKNLFKSPSLVLQMGNLIKKAIAAAYSLEVQKDENSPTLNILNAMKKLIEDEWSTEVHTETCQNAKVNRFDKPKIMPVAEDLAKLKNYLDSLLSKAESDLIANNRDETAYKDLIEGTYCNLLLFNKRRLVELQKILLTTYETHINKDIASGDFEQLLLPSENILMKKLKRIVISGKRGHNVSVLFEPKTKEAVDIAVKYRNNFFKVNNIYLFGLCNTNDHISGYHVFRKHVTKALGDAKKVASLTSIKLRKHLATILHILKMDNEELEQLASFMGHTSKTHQEWYKLPSDVYQTAKVSKVLLLSQKRLVEEYKGKRLDDLIVDDEIIETDESSDEVNCNESKTTDTEFRKKKVVIKWTVEEKQATETFFKKHIEESRAPKKDEVLQLLLLHPNLFKGRKWDSIKVYVCNQYNNKKLSEEYKGKHSDDLIKDEEINETDENSKKVNGNKSKSTHPELRKKKIVKKWTLEEKQATETHFIKHIEECIAPKKDEVLQLLLLYPDLFKGRKWDSIKVYVCNQYNKK